MSCFSVVRASGLVPALALVLSLAPGCRQSVGSLKNPESPAPEEAGGLFGIGPDEVIDEAEGPADVPVFGFTGDELLPGTTQVTPADDAPADGSPNPEDSEGGSKAPSAELAAKPAAQVMARHLVVLDDDAFRSSGERFVLASLQGILARKSATQLFFTNSSNPNDSAQHWLDVLHASRGVTSETATDPGAVLARFKAQVKGYVLFDTLSADAPPESLNVALSMAGVLGGVAVSADAEPLARQAGLSLIKDVRGKDEAWFRRTRFFAATTRSLACESKETRKPAIHDFCVMTGAFTFFDEGANGEPGPNAKAAYARLKENTPIFGWGSAEIGEAHHVAPVSAAGSFRIPSDFARNISVLSSHKVGALKQKGSSAPARKVGKVHTVTFIVTDGDNLVWGLNGLKRKYFGVPGLPSMGYGLAPMMHSLAGPAMAWYYAQARSGGIRARDQFVAGPSGLGYFYPSRMPPENMRGYLKKLSTYMKRADLDVIQILDFQTPHAPDVWDAYASVKQVKGLVWQPFGRDDLEDGEIRWARGKPVVEPRALLWESKGTPESIFSKIRKMPADPTSEKGYSLVLVHAWSSDGDKVKVLADKLATLGNRIEILGPSDFMARVAANVRRK